MRIYILGLSLIHISYSLKVNYINKSEGFYKGIQLSGKCSQKQTIKLYLRYFTDEKREKSVEKYIEVNEEWD